ncbi:MAG: valine--tRNA ligase [Candidatus Acidiferrales bacterium]
MPREIPKAYEPQEIEGHWSGAWVEKGLFRAEESPDGPVFSIVIPPPNVTGSIHIGHMLEHTQIDILVRWHRMRGFRTLWLPGTDHAGIATQVVVERELANHGMSRQNLGREEFERRVWEWKAQRGGTIKKQMIRLGASCDWSRERFTLDPPLYRAVLEAFLRLFQEGLIYRGRYMVNWCPRCMTALSDLETVHQERQGQLWYIRYPVIGSTEHVVVATTRPETMLGDTGVAVHPEDERYKHLVGRRIRLPLMNREIPVVADAFVDREFGTGAVKVTPAHDPNDFELGKRHNLPEADILTDDGHMSAAAGKYAGLDRFESRKRVIADLEEQGLLERVVNHTYSVGICDRCKTVVEPRVSIQWFCKMKPMAEPAIQVVRDGLIPIVPENQKKIYLEWMANIRDWCISRQLWWGHRIPVWHCVACKAMTPALDSRVEIVNGRARAASVPEKCASCSSKNIEQDPDVLDTWFSSALWPFSTLGWPDETPDLGKFYPTSLLISGYDILFFWDARMIMMGLHLMPRSKIEERIPFRALYLHSLVRDPEGLKMSKTRGNVIDPLEIIEKHGTDALRFTLAVMAAPGTDIALSEERILGYRAFANKIWNAARFLFVNLDKFEAAGAKLEELAAPEVRVAAPYRSHGVLGLADRWIFSRASRVTTQINDALEHFRFHEAAHVVYHFFWGEFCDWYIEWVKPQLSQWSDPNCENCWRNIFGIFEAALRLLHPFMPFLTEELWHRLPERAGAKSIALERFPEAHPDWVDEEAEHQMALLQEIIVAARNIRADLHIDQKREIPIAIRIEDASVRALVQANFDAVLRLSRLSTLVFAPGPFDAAAGIIRSTPHSDLYLSFQDAAETVDLKAELSKLRKEKDRLERDLKSKHSRLTDETFRSRAPEEIVRELEATLAQRQLEYQKLVKWMEQIEKAAGSSAAP